MKSFPVTMIFLGYALCIYSMFITWNIFLDIHIFLRLLICHIEATLFIYLLSVLFKNSSWYDAFWSVIPVVLAFMCWIDIESSGNGSRALIMFACLLFWSIRLTYNWLRSWDGFGHEDWRYIMMKSKAKNRFQYFTIDFGAIHLIPTLCVYMALLPMCMALYFQGNNVFWLDWIACIVGVAAVIIQIISDQQMYAFRKSLIKPETMSTGLWFYSRHPNYFGEILFWFSLFLFAIASNILFAWMLIGSLIMYALIAIGSVSMMDNRSLHRRPDFQNYMDTTPAIFLNLLKRNTQ
jgi:steroid 5-alpha reductase family enzyme